MTLRRHDIHVCVRDAISQWNGRAQVMHMGHKIELAADITDAVMSLLNEQNARVTDVPPQSFIDAKKDRDEGWPEMLKGD